MTVWTLWIVVAVIYAHLAEYSIHRWAMHRPKLGEFWWYTNHAVLHHGHGRNDVNIALDPLTVVIVASPLMLGCLWLPSTSWAVVVVAGSAAYSVVWSVMHAAHHDLRHHWVKSIPGYSYWREAHIKHHQYPGRNFGTVFPWTDRLFGTADFWDR